MKSNKIVTELHVKAIVAQAQKEIEAFGATMKGAWKNGDTPKNLLKTFESMKVRMASIRELANKGLISGAEVSQAESEYKNFQKSLHSLLVEFKLFSSEQKKAMLSSEEQKAMQARADAIIDYNKALEKNAEILKKQKELQDELSSKKTEKEALENKKAAIQSQIRNTKPSLSKEAKGYQVNLTSFNEKSDKIASEKKRISGLVDPKAIQRASDRIKELEDEIAKLDLVTGKADYTKAIKDYDTSLESLEEELANTETSISDADESIKKINKELGGLKAESPAESIKKLQKALKDAGVEGAETTTDFEELKRMAREMDQKGFDQVEDGIKDMISSLNTLSKTSLGVKEGIDDATDSIKRQNQTLADKQAFENKIKQFLGFKGAVEVMRRAAKDAIATIKELDATMTEMAVVTDLDISDYWDQLPQYTQRANELGLAIGDAYKADTLFYQQGLKTKEVVQLSTETMKMARVANLDTAEATDRMTAALRGFNMELNQTNAQKVADVYSQLAAITASDVDEISSAMTKTASIASSAGMEFETTAAFLSQIIETTRESAETAGTALKTVIARFQELKKDPAEIGEIDGEAVDANKIESALRSVGVSLRDASGQFRELDDVFLELSSKWDTLDKNTQRYIATVAAGSRQQSRFIAMMSDYSRTQELVAEANNSTGASNKQFEKTMESLDAKINKLKNAWHEFTMGILESDLVKFGVEMLTKFMEILNKATSSLDGLGNSLSKIITIVAVFKLASKLFKKIENPLFALYKRVVGESYDYGFKATKEYKRGAEAAAKGDSDQKDSPQTTPGDVLQKKKSAFTNFKEGAARIKAVKEKKKAANEAVKSTFEQKTKAEQQAQDDEAEAVAAEAVASKSQTKYENLSKIKKPTKPQKMARSRAKGRAEADKKTAQSKRQKANTSSEEAKKAGEAYKEAEAKAKEFKNAESEVAKESKAAWSQVGQGLQQTGAAITGLGVGISMVGGLLSSLGLEEAGEVFSILGQGLTMVGALLSAIPPILTLISSHPIIAIIVAVLAVILLTITLIAKQLEKMSPEGKLKAAQEAAEAAADAADQAAESYENLKNSLNALDDKYKSLEDLTEGTKEWNEAVQEINSSVLELIDQYPELAKFVQKDGAVLKLDMEDPGVQQALDQAQTRAITAKNNSILANAAVQKAQLGVDRKNLDAVVKRWVSTENGAVQVVDNTKTDKVAKAMASGELGTTSVEIADFLNEFRGELGMTESEIIAMSRNLADNSDQLIRYGNSIAQVETQQQAAFEAVAASALQLADTMGFTDEEKNRSANVVDGDFSEEVYNQKMKELQSKNFENLKKLDTTSREELEKAIKEQYGETAKIDDDGKVTYQKDGEDATVTLSPEQMRSLIATQQATKDTARAIENSASAIDGLSKTLGEGIKALYNGTEGGAMTQSDLSNLKTSVGESFAEEWNKKTEAEKEAAKKDNTLLPQAIQDAWNNLDADQKSVYNNDITKLADDLAKGITIANKAFTKAGDAVRDFMTADMAKGFADKLEQVANLAGGEAAKTAVQTETDKLMEGKTDKEKQEIQRRINAIDWSDLEELAALEQELIRVYGISKERAAGYVKTLGDASYATSKLTTAVLAMNDLWKTTEKLAQATERLSQAQWEYNRALKGTGVNISDAVASMQTEFANITEGYAQAYVDNQDVIARMYAQGKNKNGVDWTEYIKLGKDGIDYDKSDIDGLIASGAPREEVQEWIDGINNQYKIGLDQIKGLQDTLDQIEELEQAGEDSFYELRDLVKTTLLNRMQEQIDLAQEQLDSSQEANNNLISKIQESINESREARANKKAEDKIADLEAKRAHLVASGGSTTQIAELDKQIAESKESYQDSLIDQALSNAQDANEKAYDQRQQQIELARLSLDAYEKSAEFQAEVDSQLKTLLDAKDEWSTTEIGQWIIAGATVGMSEAERAEWVKEITGNVNLSNAWQQQDWSSLKNNITSNLTSIKDSMASLPGVISSAATAAYTKNSKTTLTGQGFSAEDLDTVIKKTGSKGITALENFTAREGTSDSINEKTAAAQKYGVAVQSKEDYYAETARMAAEGELEEVAKRDTYESYLEKQLSSNSGYKKDQARAEIQALNNRRNGLSGVDLSGMLTKYSLTKKDLDQLISEEINGGSVDGVSVSGVNPNGGYWGEEDEITATLGGTSYTLQLNHGSNGDVPSDEDAKKLETIVGQSPKNGWIAALNKKIYMYIAGNRNKWFELTGDSGQNKSFREAYLKKLRAYKTGGLADFTGPAWLDGTKSKPEIVLNQQDSANFIQLRDVLAEVMNKGSSTINTNKSGDNYYDIEINVEKIDNDYDVEQLADKIRSMIYNDATYRNVNALSYR